MILLVDTNKIFLDSMHDYLGALGYQCICAQEFVEAIEVLLKTSVIDLLITEQILPHYSGIELIQRASQIHPSLKNILVSGRDNVDLIPANVRFLAKPFSFNALGILAGLYSSPSNRGFNPDEYMYKAGLKPER